MRNSIRGKMFIAISLIIVFFVFFSWILNTTYLDKYYISQKKKSLLESSARIDKIYNGNPFAIDLELEELGRTKSLNIFIFDKNDLAIYNSDFRAFNGGKGKRKLDPNLWLLRSRLEELTRGSAIVDIALDPVSGLNYLYLASILNNGDLLLLRTPLAAINESAAIANRFSLFTGILTILAGMIIIFWFAKKFTHPILELNDMAQRMAKLDFSKKYTIKSDDELGDLGKSINSLSEQLDKSILELQEANEKLMEDIERERKIDEMRKEFISSVSHELKTPISLIQGYAEGLKVNIVEDEETKNYYCEVIIDEAAKMNQLVRNLMELSHIESGYLKLETSTFNISGLVQQILNKYEPILKEKAISLNAAIGNEINVYADVVRTEQILVNYINNAIHHIDDKKLLKISITMDNGKVRVSVFNSGQLIPEESLDKIWTSFYKVDKARTRAYGGTGLGLSIVRGIQELHHNDYGVNNRDEGVEFWFELNRAEV